MTTLDKKYCESDSDVVQELNETLDELSDEQNLKGIFIYVASHNSDDDSAYSIGGVGLPDLVRLLTKIVKDDEDENPLLP